MMGARPVLGAGQLPTTQDHVAAAESEGKVGGRGPAKRLMGLTGVGVSLRPVEAWHSGGVWIWLLWAAVLFCGQADRGVWWLGVGRGGPSLSVRNKP